MIEAIIAIIVSLMGITPEKAQSLTESDLAPYYDQAKVIYDADATKQEEKYGGIATDVIASN